MNSDFFTHHLSVSPVIAILRGLSTAETIDMALRCWDSGIHLIEVPLQSEEAIEALKAVSLHANETDRAIGAGTICTVHDVQRARDAGASFLVSPGLFPESIEHASQHNLPYLPGVVTPTEIFQAQSMSLTVQKLFPSDAIGPSVITTLKGPFPGIRFVAVGGITPNNADDFMSAGALGVGVGSALASFDALRFFSQLSNHTPTER